MLKCEKRILDFFEKYSYLFVLIAATFFGGYIRFLSRNFLSGDYTTFLESWFYEILNSGKFLSLKNQVGDYNILYQIIIAFFTCLNIKPLYAYKIFSILFDYCLAAGCGFLACDLIKNKFNLKIFSISYSVILLLPTVFLNSSFWAQCDSVYTFFIILSILLIRKNKNIPAFILLGISFAFKLQFILIIPFFIILYVCYRKFSIFHFLLIPVVGFITSLPAVFMGRKWSAFFDIYFNQTDEYKLMSLNISNIWSGMPTAYGALKKQAILLTFMILFLGFVLFVKKKKKMDNAELFLVCATWTVWTCVMFLPAMHERYTYPVDILLAILVVVHFKKYFIFFIVNEIAVFLMYSHYLFGAENEGVILIILYVSIYLIFTYQMVKDFWVDNNSLQREGK